MPTPVRAPAKQFTSWSFSRYTDYKTCPAKAKYKHLDKLPEPPNEAMARGSAIHTLAENYVKGTIPRLPKELKSFSDEFKDLRTRRKKDPDAIVVEDTWALTRDWKSTRWNDWTGCWLRIKLDCAALADDHLDVIDFKTGKMSAYRQAEYNEQLDLYALGALLYLERLGRPEVVVVPSLWYLDHGILYTGSEEDNDPYTQEDLPGLKKKWAALVKPMFVDNRFAPKPNNTCQWCAFSRAKGGPCEF